MPVTTHSAKPVDSLEGLSSEISFDDFAPTQKVEFNKGRAGEAGDADDEAMNWKLIRLSTKGQAITWTGKTGSENERQANQKAFRKKEENSKLLWEENLRETENGVFYRFN